MTTRILFTPRKLRLDTLSVPSSPLHRRSQNQLDTPSVRHHSGKRITSIIPCTCSDPSILNQPGKPCLVAILYPSPESLFRRSKRYGLVSPLRSRNSSASLSLESVKDDVEEEAMDVQDALSFQYYLAPISTDSADHYTDASWVAFDMRGAHERAETEEMLLGDFYLPFVDKDNFNYYPERSPRPLGAVSMEENLVLKDRLEEVKSEKLVEKVQEVKVVEKARRKSRLKEMMTRLAKNLSCKQ
ncbi:hypothetical protein DPSP01_005381 [Paraphaeosphaeria sporulosa]